MTQGERGGTTSSLAEAEQLHEQYRAEWRTKIRWRIVRCLVEKRRFHAADLVDLEIPEDCKNVIGSCIAAAKQKGLMLETGERLPSTDAAGHRRRSAVYTINPAAAKGLAAKWRRHQAITPPAKPTRLFDTEPAGKPNSYFDAEEAA
jgi:hypothetical protein